MKIADYAALSGTELAALIERGPNDIAAASPVVAPEAIERSADTPATRALTTPD